MREANSFCVVPSVDVCAARSKVVDVFDCRSAASRLIRISSLGALYITNHVYHHRAFVGSRKIKETQLSCRV